MKVNSGPAAGKATPQHLLPGWRALSEAGRAPTHYELLGISPAEADPGRIEAAAIGRASHVRRYQLAYPAECTLLLNRIGLAFETLADPARRRAYDDELGRQGLGSDRRRTVVAKPRVRSGFLDALIRRGKYRRRRQELRAARGESQPGEREDSPSQRPGPCFLLVDRQGGSARVLHPGANILGRLRSNDIVMEDPAVSRRHCAILVHPQGRCELHDFASRNGTRVNGRRARRPVPLASGDQVQVGRVLFLFVTGEDYRAKFGDRDTLAG